MSPAMTDVMNERQRQIEAEGYNAAHDDTHAGDRGLARAAVCYAKHYIRRQWVFEERPENYKDEAAPNDWPWSDAAWKPKNPRRDLIRAAALLIAQIDQMDRAAPTPKP